jgi:hypothetical protein
VASRVRIVWLSWHLPNRGVGSDNRCVQSPARPTPHPRADLFPSDARVILPLRNPWRKRRAEGLGLSDVELSWFDDHVAMVTEGKPLDPGEGFPRTHAAELSQLDPSDARRAWLADRLAARVTIDPFALLDLAGAAQLALRVRW